MAEIRNVDEIPDWEKAAQEAAEFNTAVDEAFQAGREAAAEALIAKFRHYKTRHGTYLEVEDVMAAAKIARGERANG